MEPWSKSMPGMITSEVTPREWQNFATLSLPSTLLELSPSSNTNDHQPLASNFVNRCKYFG